MTQFGRSLHALNIDILCANTPQAKGRGNRLVAPHPKKRKNLSRCEPAHTPGSKVTLC